MCFLFVPGMLEEQAEDLVPDFSDGYSFNVFSIFQLIQLAFALVILKYGYLTPQGAEQQIYKLTKGKGSMKISSSRKLVRGESASNVDTSNVDTSNVDTSNTGVSEIEIEASHLSPSRAELASTDKSNQASDKPDVEVRAEEEVELHESKSTSVSDLQTDPDATIEIRTDAR
jgi:hypothetical protein